MHYQNMTLGVANILLKMEKLEVKHLVSKVCSPCNFHCDIAKISKPYGILHSNKQQQNNKMVNKDQRLFQL